MNPLHIFDDVELTDGRRVKLLIFSRGGIKSDSMWAYEVGGRLITPFEQRVRGWAKVKNAYSILLRIYMPEALLREELMKTDTLFSRVLKDESWGGSFIVPFEFGDKD